MGTQGPFEDAGLIWKGKQSEIDDIKIPREDETSQHNTQDAVVIAKNELDSVCQENFPG